MRNLSDDWTLAELEAPNSIHFLAHSFTRNSKQTEQFGFKETAWSLEYEPDPICSGKHVGPYLRMDFNLRTMCDDELALLADAILRFYVRACDGQHANSGLLDVADVSNTATGNYYSGTGIGWVTFQRQVARQVWIDAGRERSQRARGVFWGNLLSPVMVEKLGGAEQFVCEYDGLSNESGGDLCKLMPDGSMLVLLSKRIKEMMFPFRSLMPRTIRRGVWLHQRLCAAGLMCGQ